MRTKVSIIFGVGLLLTWRIFAVWTQGSEYQDRGDRFEGCRLHPVGGTSIELLGATIDSRTSSIGSREFLSLSFFLHDPIDVNVVVREREPLENYWLDQVKPAKPWMARQINRFSWSANAVLNALRLDQTKLTALARLGYAEPRIDEFVAPVQLEAAGGDFFPGDYRFTFQTSRPAFIKIVLVACPGKAVPSELETGRRIPFDIRAQLSGPNTGKCRLQLNGWMSDDGTEVLQTVDFFPVPKGLAK